MRTVQQKYIITSSDSLATYTDIRHDPITITINTVIIAHTFLYALEYDPNTGNNNKNVNSNAKYNSNMSAGNTNSPIVDKIDIIARHLSLKFMFRADTENTTNDIIIKIMVS